MCEHLVPIQQSRESNSSLINLEIFQEEAKLDPDIVAKFYSDLDKPIAQLLKEKEFEHAPSIHLETIYHIQVYHRTLEIFSQP